MTDEVFFEMFVKEPYENGHKDGKQIEIITESLKLTQKDLQIIKAAK